MKNKLMFIISILIISVAKPVLADTCPPIEGLSPNSPPAGWTLLVPPVMDDQKYYFGAAIHSLNGVFYNGQVICKYEACPNSFCPAFALLSDKTYVLPNTKKFPWNSPSKLDFTFTCIPVDHDPTHCVFQ